NYSVTTNSNTLTVMDVPVITVQPASVTNNAGSTANFTVTVTGGGTLHYQWQRAGTNILDGGDIIGATTASLTLSNVLAGDSTNYTVVITNDVGSATSDGVAFLTVIDPYISADPSSVTNNAGTTLTLTVGVTGTTPLSYQWLKNSVAISGETNSSFVVSNVL